MSRLFASLARNRHLLRDFVVRDLRARYVGSSMGFFWSVIFPIINLLLYMFVFRILLKSRWSDYQGPEEVAVIMLAGIVVWAAFAEAMSRNTNILIENANLIQKIVFPSEILPAYITISCLVNMMIAMPVVLVAVWYVMANPTTDPELIAKAVASGEPGLDIGITLVMLPVLALLQAVFMIGIGMFFATLNLYWRDTYHLMGVATTAWMFSTPIFYPAAVVDKEGFSWMLTINPMHWLIECYRNVLITNTWPDGWLLAKFALVAALTLAVGSAFFFRQRRHFPDLL